MEIASISGGSNLPVTENWKLTYASTAQFKKYIELYGIDQVVEHFRETILTILNQPDEPQA